MVIYTVKNGDSVYSIANEYGTTPSRIIIDNELENPGRLATGQNLVILYPTQTYTVRGGDTLLSIAEQFGVSVNQLWRNNPVLRGSSAVFPGQTLNISYDPPTLGEISTNGYAYPYIDRDTLRTTLPYLTYLSIFTYGLNDDGTLIEPEGGDDEIIAIAKEYGTVPLMMLTSLTEAGTFSDRLVANILSSDELKDRVIENAVNTMVAKGYGGIDVDFEYIGGQYAESYTDFITKLNAAMPSDEYVVFASLAPKTSADQPGLLYEGHDYGAVGAAADNILLMTYEWGYTYGPPLPVAPINNVRRVLDYGITAISPDKIFFGMPNYGYDWTLPYVRGESMAESLSNKEAVQRAVEKDAEITFNEEAQSPTYSYFQRVPNTDENAEHIVWFEDARSADAKLRLVNEYGIRGVSVWNIMRYFPSLWSVLNSLYSIRRIESTGNTGGAT